MAEHLFQAGDLLSSTRYRRRRPRYWQMLAFGIAILTVMWFIAVTTVRGAELPVQTIISTSPGFQVLSSNGCSGP
jgi:hypothetical protein